MGDHDDGVQSKQCFVCLEADDDVLPPYCACRGGAGYCHRACLVQLAQSNKKWWAECQTCDVAWTGAGRLGMCRARYALAADSAQDDRERLEAAMNLARALSESGLFSESVELSRATLAISRQALGNGSDVTLDLIGGLATALRQMGDSMAAIPLHEECLALLRQNYGKVHLFTLMGAHDLAVTYKDAGKFDAALPLLVQAVGDLRRLGFTGDEAYFVAINNLANLHADMGNGELALPLYRESVEKDQRRFGPTHPHTLMGVSNLGVTLKEIGSFVEAQPLLEEAAAGFLAAYGQEHPDTKRCTNALASNSKCLADPMTAVATISPMWPQHKILKALQQLRAKACPPDVLTLIMQKAAGSTDPQAIADLTDKLDQCADHIAQYPRYTVTHDRLECKLACCSTRTTILVNDGVMRKFSFYPCGADASKNVERMNFGDPPPANTPSELREQFESARIPESWRKAGFDACHGLSAQNHSSCDEGDINTQTAAAPSQRTCPPVRAQVIKGNKQFIGTTVKVLKYNHKKDRYIIRLPSGAGGRKSLCAPSSLKLEVGTAVVLVGLVSASQLNRSRGQVEGFNLEKQRYVVRIQSTAKIIQVKLQNCRAIVPGSEYDG
jgi:tetratricopeptide (TPR) repeat protein